MKRKIRYLIMCGFISFLICCASLKKDNKIINSDCLKNSIGDHYLCTRVSENNHLIVTVYSEDEVEIYRRNVGAIGSAKWENDRQVMVTILPANPGVNHNEIRYLIDIETGKLIPLNQENREKE